MYQIKIFSFILAIFNLSAGNAEIGSGIHKDILLVKSTEEIDSNGVIVKRVSENLTLSCYYMDPDNSVRGDHRDQKVIQLKWLLPNDDTNNRSMTTWFEGNTFWLSIARLESKDAGTYTCLDADNSMNTAQVHVAVKTTVTSFPYCGRAMFPCVDDIDNIMKKDTLPYCIAFSFVCDGVPDCGAPARDESPEICKTHNPCEGKIQCSDGRCIPRDWCCYGKPGCILHSCCTELDVDFPMDRTGGPLRRKPSGPPLLQTTLYTVIVCMLVFLIAVILLISAICKARFKRAALYRERAQSREPNDYERILSMQRDGHPGSPDILPDYHSYTLLAGNDPNDGINASRPVSPDTNPTLANRNGLPTYSDAQINIERNVGESTDSPARRPTDFGGGTLSNAIFNSRYRPVPQNSTDIPSFVDITDSDSSCRSPGSHVWANRDGTRSIRLYPATSFGESPSETYNPTRRVDDRRIRRANALDRILDRFGLNPPYAVDAVAQIRSDGTEDIQNDTERHGRRRFVSSILGRLRNGLSRNRRTEECSLPQPLNNVINNLTNDRLNNNSGLVVTTRRRPDTPNVLELTPDCDLRSNGETYTLNGRTIHLLGGNFENRPDLYSLSFQGLYIVDGIVGNLNNFVGRPVSPPPYSEIANAAPSKVLGPPPPYMSRENLNVMETEFNSNETAGASNSNVSPGLDVVLENIGDNSASGVTADINSDLLLRDFDDLNGNVASNVLDILNDVESSLSYSHLNNNTLIDLSRNISTDSDNVNSIDNNSYATARGEVDNAIADNNVAAPSCSTAKQTINSRQREHRPSVELKNLDSCGILINKTLRQMNTIDSDLNFAGIIRGEDLRNGNVDSDTPSLNCQSSVKSTDDIDGQNSSVLGYGDHSNVLDRNDNSRKPLRTCVFPPVNLEFIDSDCITD